jgi:hypothetical protein
MWQSRIWLGALVAAAPLTFLTGTAAAAQVRFHYVPIDACGRTALQPTGGGAGETLRWFGRVREPTNVAPRPTHVVTFRHPYTGHNVSVPMALPQGTPRIEYARTRIVYNYGSYTVEAQFRSDGSVDVVYNSGFLRAP